MNKNLLFSKISILTVILCGCLMAFSSSFALWWGTPGYEWALRNGLTGQKTHSQLQTEVELDDLYATILKYLSMKNVTPSTRKIHHTDKMIDMDPVAKGIADIINEFNSKNHLTIMEFYNVESYADDGYKTLDKYRDLSQYLTRADLKNIDTFFRLSKYRAAMLIESRAQREYALSRLGYVKNAKVIDYGILPYTEKVSRKEFLLIMYDLLSKNSRSEDNVIDSFYDTGVLIGYETGLELDKKLLYSEMYSFLYRFEVYDFDSSGKKNALTDLPTYISNAISGTVSKSDFIAFLDDVYENTDHQLNLISRIESELGDNWTLREAGDYLNEVYAKEGFKYTKDGNTVSITKSR